MQAELATYFTAQYALPLPISTVIYVTYDELLPDATSAWLGT
jgi:hypothetical protein